MHKTILTAGFAMFSMFFGSGNLVFPILLGTTALSNYRYAIGGVFITAVVVPFIGLISMIAFEGQRERFFSSLGKWPGFVLTFMMLALMGPFGVIPRCITVAYGGLKLIFPNLSLPLFSLIFCLIIGFLIWRPNRVVDIIGLILTPFKLGGLLLLIIFGLYYADAVSLAKVTNFDSFKEGFMLGYQTMDLIAAFFFSATIVEYLKNKIGHNDSHQVIKSSIYASLIGASILGLVYFGFVSLGAHYAPHLVETSPEALLAAIAKHTLGHYALIIVGVTLAVSCLATATILTLLFVDFLKVDLVDHIAHLKLPTSASIAGTLAITYVLSLMGFTYISYYLVIILQIAYPPLIALAIHHILSFWFKISYAKPVFWTCTALSVIAFLIQTKFFLGVIIFFCWFFM